MLLIQNFFIDFFAAMQSDKEFLRDLGKKIKELREEKNLSQQELADMVDVAKSTIQRLEYGKYNPSLLILRRIIECLDFKFASIDKIQDYHFLCKLDRIDKNIDLN